MNCRPFVILKVMVEEAPAQLEKTNAFSLQNKAWEYDCFSYRTDGKPFRLACFDSVEAGAMPSLDDR